MSTNPTEKKRTKRPKKVVEYRWFPATPSTGILGGIIAPTQEVAETWAASDLGANDKKRTLVRVKMEYEL